MTNEEKLKSMPTNDFANFLIDVTIRHILEANNAEYNLADVAPVKHGKWVRIYNTEDSDCACSVCYRVQARPVGCYCKWCGARMDGE